MNVFPLSVPGHDELQVNKVALTTEQALRKLTQSMNKKRDKNHTWADPPSHKGLTRLTTHIPSLIESKAAPLIKRLRLQTDEKSHGHETVLTSVGTGHSKPVQYNGTEERPKPPSPSNRAHSYQINHDKKWEDDWDEKVAIKEYIDVITDLDRMQLQSFYDIIVDDKKFADYVWDHDNNKRRRSLINCVLCDILHVMIRDNPRLAIERHRLVKTDIVNMTVERLPDFKKYVMIHPADADRPVREASQGKKIGSNK